MAGTSGTALPLLPCLIPRSSSCHMVRGERKGIKEGIKEEGGVGREGGRGVETEEVEVEEEVAAETEEEETEAETKDMRMGIKEGINAW